ncbi:hypothetical protein, partial [Pseudomonas aeruginosa]|uniref:hypothetical protein n=1 Tax=Pseudomonas aeruginosa TaxID=287 RepID=UPI003CC56F01
GRGYGGQRSVEPSAYSFGDILKASSPILDHTVQVTSGTRNPPNAPAPPPSRNSITPDSMFSYFMLCPNTENSKIDFSINLSP